MSCRTPIQQVGCKLQPNGYVEAIYFGAWGAPPADFATAAAGGHIDYVVPDPNPNGIAYTSNWCNTWGTRGVCTAGAASSSVLGSNIQGDQLPAATWTAGSSTDFGTWTLPYVNTITVCYGKKRVRGVSFGWQSYDAQWVLPAGSSFPPQSVVTPGADTGVATCGVIDGCLYQQTFTAPDGEVLGAIEGKCKFSQGWFKYVSNGQYTSKYYLEGIKKVCTLPPTPPPIGRFTICPNCNGDPNEPNPDANGNPQCTDYNRYQCQPDCKK